MRCSLETLARCSLLGLLLPALATAGEPPPVMEWDVFQERTRKPAAEPSGEPEYLEPEEGDVPAPTLRALVSAAPMTQPPPAGEPRPGLEIHIFDIGQADSMLVVGPPPGRRTLLVDLGEPTEGQKENYFAVAQRILDITESTEVDYFILSHYHADHVGTQQTGVAGLLDWVSPQFRISTFIDLQDIGAETVSPSRSTKEKLERNMERWLEHGKVGRRVKPRFGSGQVDLGKGVEVDFVTFGGMAFEGDPGVFHQVMEQEPNRYRNAPGSENDISIGIEISYKEFELLTAGDLTGYDPKDWPDVATLGSPLYTHRSYHGGKRETYTNVESHLARYWYENGRESDVEVYRANHHGSRYSSAPEFLDALDPEYVVYSAGGQHNHPEKSIIRRSAGTAAQLVTTRVASPNWSTFRDAGGKVVSEIVIEVAKDGEQYEVEEVRHKTYSDAEERADRDVGEEDRGS